MTTAFMAILRFERYSPLALWIPHGVTTEGKSALGAFVAVFSWILDEDRFALRAILD